MCRYYYLGSNASGRNGDLLDDILAVGGLESEGLLNNHVGLAARLALGAVLDGLVLDLFVSAFISELLVTSALGGLLQINFGKVSGVLDVERLAILGLLGQTAGDGVVLLGRAALSAGQLEAGGHELTVGNGATVGGLEFTGGLLVVVTAKTASMSAELAGSSKLNVGSLNLDEEVERPDLHDDTVQDGVDDSLDGLVVEVTDLEAGILVQGLDGGLDSVDGNGASGVQLDGIVTIDNLDDLNLTLLAGKNGDFGFLSAISHQDMLALVDGVVVETCKSIKNLKFMMFNKEW